MKQEVTPTNNRPIDRDQVRATVASLYASIRRDDMRRDTLSRPIDPTMRKEMQNYQRDMHGRLRPISTTMVDRDKAQAAVGSFLQSYLNARTANPAATLNAYMAVLLEQPLFAIYAAVDDFKNGRVFDLDKDGARIPFTLDHAPSAPRLLDQAKKRAADVQEEKYKVTRLLAIEKVGEPEVPPEERERVGFLMSDLASRMKMQAAADREMDVKKIRAEADEARARAARIVQEATARRRAEAQAG